jgi:hypothetical protein
VELHYFFDARWFLYQVVLAQSHSFVIKFGVVRCVLCEHVSCNSIVFKAATAALDSALISQVSDCLYVVVLQVIIPTPQFALRTLLYYIVCVINKQLTNGDEAMTHQHTVSSSKQISVKGQPVLVEQCTCGAQHRPNGQPPKHERTVLLGDGWYTIRPDREAYDRLQNEGYPPETHDADDIADGVQSNIPNID